MKRVRGQSHDYDHWAQLGNRGWSWDDVLPVFKRSEDYQHGANEFHGAGGELRVEERRVTFPAKKVSCATFGGDDYTDIYVTTAGGDNKPEEGDGGGGLFRVNLNIRGVEEFHSSIGL